MIKGAIFDVDGTILDSMPFWDNLCENYLFYLNIKPDSNIKEILSNKNLEDGIIYLKENYKIKKSTKEIKIDIFNLINDFYSNKVKPKEGIYSFLQNLKKLDISMVIASSSDKKLLENALKNLDLLHFFENIFTCDELKTNKTQPDIYLYSAKYLNLKNNEILVFEDDLNGIVSSKKENFKVIGIEEQINKKDKNHILEISDYYMKDFNNFDIFWSYILKNFNK